ncbi:MAG TPA: hypothetical protein VGN53_01530 [Klebsiella sp.]|jgi:hypothetical protein
MIDDGLGAFSVISADLWTGLQLLAAKLLVKKKTAGDQRADNQQDQDELKTIAPQHSALRKKTALKPAPISYQTT